MSKRDRDSASKSGQGFGNTGLRDALSKLKTEERARAEREEKEASAARDRARAEAKLQKRAQAGARPATSATSATVRSSTAALPSSLSPSQQRGSTAPAPTGPDDDLLFRIAMEDVIPLDRKGGGKGQKVTARAPAPVLDVVSEDAEALAQLAELVATGEGLDLSDTDEYMEGISHGVDRSLLEALRRGDFSVQGHVDLHGLGVEAAREELEKFLFESRRKGARCVVVVHGRGLHSKDREPVLKERVGVWLSRGKLSRIVLAFATARPADGGAGAVYVLLRR